MGLSKSTRIKILLAIDTAFFLLELIVGYAVHSLALVADSFHMLNDIISLLVGLWAVKIASSRKRSTVYTYGWQRAETLGALINGVFLVALCVSIFLEAIQRFVEPQEVSHPVLILGVGSAGLVSNIVGLVLFHDHSHGHGHSRSEVGHEQRDLEEARAAEEGHVHGSAGSTVEVAEETGNVADVLPQSLVANWPPTNTISAPRKRGSFEQTGLIDETTPSMRGRRRRSRSRQYSGLEEIMVHPASFRDGIIAASRMGDIESEPPSDAESERDQVGSAEAPKTPTETSPLLVKSQSQESARRRRLSVSNLFLHNSHKHAQAKEESRKSHGHGHDLNMRGVFLHVMGDALGNIGVIATALFIWLTSFSWRFYADPFVSLVITVIILLSAIPLCKAASRILLQAVPAGLSIEDIKEDIMSLPDIRSCHHLHVWQLSDTKLVASLHVQVDFEFKGEGSQRYMALARQIRKCLHEYGIHSSTIQPEFCCEARHKHKLVLSREHSDTEDTCDEEQADAAASGRNATHGCLLDCDDECGDGGKCCAPAAVVKERQQQNDDASNKR